MERVVLAFVSDTRFTFVLNARIALQSRLSTFRLRVGPPGE